MGRPASGGLQRERLDRALARASDAPLREGNRLEILRNGPDTYEDWLAAISGAERWVHLDNYIFSDDEVGERFARALLAGSAAHPRVRPERPIRSSDRDARRGVAGSGSGGSATILRVGSTALQKSGYPLEIHEQALAAAASGALLGASLLSLRFPRFLAWPLAAVGALYGGLGVLRAARSTLSERIGEGSTFPNPRWSASQHASAFGLRLSAFLLW